MYRTYFLMVIFCLISIKSIGVNPEFGDSYMFLNEMNKTILKINVLPKDSDGDGIRDSKDLCPLVPGLKKFKGCPDSDNDGIEDAKDFCPNLAGLLALKGCPDSDGDGFSDKEDLCPNLFGLEVYNGCPDTDQDGVMDSKDHCPTEAGPIENKGCPGNIKISDFESEPNQPDQVESEANTALKITKTDLEFINIIAKEIKFESASMIYSKSTMEQLDALVLILKNFKKEQWRIEGFTDNIGTVEDNQSLSAKRANSVRDYLISKGLDSKNFIAIGLGEKNPIDTNMYKNGRANNRRVEFKLIQ